MAKGKGPSRKGAVTHHCSGAKVFGTNCRMVGDLCVNHQIFCPDHGIPTLNGYPCGTCIRTQQMADKLQAQAERERKQQEKQAAAEAAAAAAATAEKAKTRWTKDQHEDRDKKMSEG
ncbi:hypothetical protein F5Y16DRAFT_403008 [Xylariaceae sp. FL0255]|nr:hypothetical protein F5Y16DRAFT_403008 [Xylariaceae sp. FL0255]